MSVFKSRRALLHDYTPPRLPHRERQLRELKGYFGPVLNEGVTAKVHVHGPIGTGKTVLCKRFGTDLEAEAAELGVKVRYVHINLSYTPKPYHILTQLLDQVSFVEAPRSGLSPEEMLAVVARALGEEDCSLVLALDEVDTYIAERRDARVLYMLGRLHELHPDPTPRLSLIYVSRSLDWIKRLDKATLDTLGRVSAVHLQPYGLEELRDILRYRAEEALFSMAFSDEVIHFIADIALGYGGIRYALELLTEAGAQADLEGKGSVRVEHVRRAHVNIPKGLNGAYYPDELSLHKQLLLTAVIRTLMDTWDPYVAVEEVYERYRVICDEYEREPEKTKNVDGYLKDLEVGGYILLREEGTLVGVEFPLDRMRKAMEEALSQTLQLSGEA